MILYHVKGHDHRQVMILCHVKGHGHKQVMILCHIKSHGHRQVMILCHVKGHVHRQVMILCNEVKLCLFKNWLDGASGWKLVDDLMVFFNVVVMDTTCRLELCWYMHYTLLTAPGYNFYVHYVWHVLCSWEYSYRVCARACVWACGNAPIRG